MKQHIIGLDLGTNSIGWALITEDGMGKVDIIKTGVHVFPIGTIVDDKSGKEKTRNEQRREYRGASRMRFRFKMRRENLTECLKDNGMFPNYSKYHKIKEGKQSYELYQLRANALDQQIPLQEIGRIFMLLNKYRGFKSNSKKLTGKDKEEGKVKDGIGQLETFMKNNGARTIGEYFFKMHQKAKELYDKNQWHNDNEPIDERALDSDGKIELFNSNGIRRHHGRYTDRKMYETEFDLIWEQQMNYYPEILTGSPQKLKNIKNLPHNEKIQRLKEFKNTLFWKIKEHCIYYQRPLKSQKKYISNCQFEKSKKAIPVSHPLFQEFRIYKTLNQIRYANEKLDITKEPLDKNWIPIIANYLKHNYNVYLNPTGEILKKDNKGYLVKLLNVNDSHKFYIDAIDADVPDDEKNKNSITGNTTYASFYEALGKERFSALEKAGKLELLWHHIYMAKDGLMKEDEWLKSILTEKSKWDFPPEVAQKFIDNGLEGGYGSYSAKVIKAIIPFMRNGDDEYTALIKAGYLKSPDEVSEIVALKEKISQLKYQELRNPVVEKAVSQAIRIVNSILKKYKSEIDQNKFEIRIESTRELKKPRKEREKLRKSNLDKDKIRQEYADFLNNKKDVIGITKRIEKYDSLINKFELWLEMGFDKTDESFKAEDFKAFAKVIKPEDRIKHKLWLECNRVCPYSNKMIPLGKLFNPEVEIEHIIPLSRSLDNSFNNKTLTYFNINKEKGARTAYEYMKSKNELSLFKRRIKGANFSDSKIERFLNEKVNITFTNDQITNTSYIAKYTRKKMQEVCRNVQFTNGSATADLRMNDWLLSSLLDQIRYEEETGINMTEVFINYYRLKKEFRNWTIKKYRSTDIKIDWGKIDESQDVKDYERETKNELTYYWNEVSKFNAFKSKAGKKDRSDHRHHAIDAFVIACCSPAIIRTLSTYNAARENRGEPLTNEYGNITRERIEKNFSMADLKESIMNILVSHYENQSLIKKRINKIKTKQGLIKHNTYAPQGKLHQESYYGKSNGDFVRRVELYSDVRQEKVLFERPEDLEYKVKGNVKWYYVPDTQLLHVVKSRLEKLGKRSLSKEQMVQNPLFMTSPATPNKTTSKKEGKPLPIVKSVRKKFNIERSMINLPAMDIEGNILFKNRWADNETNYLIVFYKSGDKKFAKPLKFFDAVERKRKKEKLLPDEIEYRGEIYGINRLLPWLKIGDLIFLFKKGENINTIDWNNHKLLTQRLFKVKGLTSLVTPNSKYGDYEFGRISLQNIKRSQTDKYSNQKDIEEALKEPSFILSHDKFDGIKVRLNSLGEIVAKGAECFEKELA